MIRSALFIIHCSLFTVRYSLFIMIYLLRHGEIALEGEKRFIGQTDIPLSEKGLQQARRWHRRFAETTIFERIYCSDLSRSSETARIIAGDTGYDHILPMPQLREIRLGEWEGIPLSEIRAAFPQEWEKRGQLMDSYRPPGGESFSDLYRRVLPVFEHIAEYAGGNSLIVAHAGVNRVILCHVLGMPLAGLFRLGQDYGSLNIIDCQKKPFRVAGINLRAGEF
jgi:probable phosphoglycerate mutase